MPSNKTTTQKRGCWYRDEYTCITNHHTQHSKHQTQLHNKTWCFSDPPVGDWKQAVNFPTGARWKRKEREENSPVCSHLVVTLTLFADSRTETKHTTCGWRCRTFFYYLLFYLFPLYPVWSGFARAFIFVSLNCNAHTNPDDFWLKFWLRQIQDHVCICSKLSSEKFYMRKFRFLCCMYQQRFKM